MSFWPFGQNLHHSNINKILDEYFHVLHEIEKINPSIGKAIPAVFNKVQQRGTNESLESIPEEYSHATEVRAQAVDRRAGLRRTSSRSAMKRKKRSGV